jgi:hypothetical protein
LPKTQKPVVAVKNQQVYSAKDPLKLLEILNENKIDPRHAVTEFIRDKTLSFYIKKGQ